MNVFPRATPTAHHVDAGGLLAFLDAAERQHLGLHSLMIARHGDVVAEGWWAPYAPDRVHLAYSLSKTLTATAVAVLATDGVLDIDAPVLSHFPEIDQAGLSPRWRAVTVAHCLSMSVGHATDAVLVLLDPADEAPGAAELDPLRRLVATELDAEPGTLFTYNQVATYMLSLVVGRLTGTPLHGVVRERFLDRMGAAELPWHTNPLGTDLGWSGAHVTTETILAVAQLALDRGRWRGERLVADWWYDRATVPFAPVRPEPGTAPDWSCGYGFSYWMQRAGFRGDGAYGQYAITLPDRGLAIAITSEVEDMQQTLNALWDHVVPALDRPGDPDADAELAARLATVAYSPLVGGAGGPTERVEFARAAAGGERADAPGASPTGQPLASHYDALTIAPVDGGSAVALRRGDAWLGDIEVGDGAWRESTITSDGWRLPIVASGGWTTPDRFEAEVRVIETPHRFHVAATLAGETTGIAELTWALAPLMGPDPLTYAVRR